MEKVVEYIVKALVDNKESVKVKSEEDENNFTITVSVAPEELGRVVGRGGQNAHAIRTLVHSLAGKDGFLGKKLLIKFLTMKNY